MNFHDLCFCHIPWKERKRTTNCAIITPFPWSIFRYSLDQSARKKSACYQIKKIVFGALLTQQKIRCHYFVVNKIIAF